MKRVAVLGLVVVALAACGGSQNPGIDAAPIDAPDLGEDVPHPVDGAIDVAAIDVPGRVDAATFGACDGTHGAPGFAAMVSDGTNAFQYDNFQWGANNDCPAADAPAGVVSVTIQGHQLEEAPGGMGFCLPRPDLINGDPILLTDATRVQIAGMSASIGSTGCAYSLVSADASPTGTIAFAGFCTAAGTSYALTLDGTIVLHKMCSDGTTPPSTVTVTLQGTVAVGPR